uniref:Uncharacterized LOC112153060 n=1 Tax=Oryzias melastigma TaxID=30732 RepID=A0A3B3BNY4_ORYME
MSAVEGELLSLSTSSSLSSSSAAAATGAQTDSSPKSESNGLNPTGDRLLSTEEQVTLITESLTVTSTDQEKLLLLNKNTELRRVNKELMKLNEDWDQVYRSATLGLQHRLESLELENNAIKQLNSRLAKEYYEHALMTELKKNQELQEYIRLLESKMHPDRTFTPLKQVIITAVRYPEAEWQGRSQDSVPLEELGNSQQEVQDLKEQLDALRCQTEIYEAEFQTEHNDHKHTLQENRRLRKKREEMRQQVALLQEQLKIYEDDFRRERSDKQMLQRLLVQKSSSNKHAVLIHRCNNQESEPQMRTWCLINTLIKHQVCFNKLTLIGCVSK